MNESIPAFSIFSAVSELLVTVGVLFVIWRNWKRKLFPLWAFLAVVLFEGFVNVMYMASRASHAASGGESLAPGLKLFFAIHGIVSLLAFLAFVLLGIFAYQDQKASRFFFRDHPIVTWIFLVVWIFSVGSGEVIFFVRYLV